MKIALDAMGGDQGPELLIDGALRALRRNKELSIVLLGPEDLLKERIAQCVDSGNVAGRLLIEHAPETVTMEESPVEAIRKKKDSTIMRGFDLVKNGQADAVVSAGHSGATMAAAIRKLGRLEGVSRPGIASLFPTRKTPVMLMDIGANVDCRPQHLFQFAVMASSCCALLQNKKSPRVGLLSIGSEPGKGNALIKETHELLRQSNLNFVGNVEGRDVYGGELDVVVCDGFVGNISLKISEGLAEAAMQMLKDEIMKSLRAKIGYLLIRKAFTAFRKRVDYAEYGGAPLLGINGIGIICHGSSSSVAICNAIGEAAKLVENKVNDSIVKSLRQYITA
ncbi:phosphate:acyl-[acyl carrier protein] acyltransferase [Candidatus Electrothrix aarhusensis]|uniref:Phosphate acyltransferase n=1 Tax=Candidatus Electrothrix aarhusensis TaxID=1859131 RepID=A0A3S4T7V1_9BACT|nr:phosphate:acyl-[acyl carrier protein] acyltransferase [Candidatus Electrothrix aarhusensis]